MATAQYTKVYAEVIGDYVPTVKTTRMSKVYAEVVMDYVVTVKTTRMTKVYVEVIHSANASSGGGSRQAFIAACT